MVTELKNKYCELHSHTYNYRIDSDSSKYTSYGYQLINIVNSIIRKNKIETIKDESYMDANHQRLIDYTVSRIINIGYYYLDTFSEESTQYESKLLAKLNEFLDIEQEYINKLFILIKNICIHYEKTNPPQKIKDTIRKYAKESLHSCYVCGRKLDADKQTSTKMTEIKEKKDKKEYFGDLLEIEHILPRVYGGGLNKENITVACEHCNKIKDDKLSYADCYFEDFIVSSDNETAINSKLTKNIKFSILYKQEFKCNECNIKLYDLDIDKIIFYKKEDEEPFHFTNILMCCENCSNSKQIKGVEYGLYL
jgi:5-methylcytosine-specific restriction endonuclease McrA